MKKRVLFHHKRAAKVFFGIIAVSIALVSCQNYNPINEPVTGSYFDYKTTIDYTLNLNLSPTGNPIGITRFELYTTNPIANNNGIQSFIDSIKPNFTGFTDESGNFTGIVSVPTYTKIIYIYTNRPGIKNLRSSTLEGYTINIDESNSSEELKAPAVVSYSTITVPNTLSTASWNASGVPNNIYTRDVIPVALTNDIQASLPEGAPLTSTHPEYIKNDAVSELIVKDTATIDVAFVHEGAGYLNVLGYYYYPTANPPALADLKKYIVFPNTSFAGSGGGLYAGDRVHLLFYNGLTYTEKFPPGYTVGWFIIANGYNSSSFSVTPGYYTHYANPNWNNEANVNLKQHVIQLYDNTRNIVVLSFEDIRRDYGACDQDFNDAIFYAIATPITAVVTSGMSQIDRFVDTDGDGVGDSTDEFPLDPKLAKRVYYPSQNTFGTLAYEDLWPSQGDYDLNDLVVDYNYINYVNAQNQVVKSDGTFRVRAAGAKFLNGFGFQLGVAPFDVSKVTVTGGSLTEGVISTDANGLESGQTKANIILFDNVYKLFNLPSGSFINTDGQTKVPYKSITVSIELKTPQPLSALTTPPYNAYLIADCGNGVRGKEVHLPGFKPTDKANQSLFSTGQDLTYPSKNRYFVATNNMPFAIMIPQSFLYPSEKNSISDAYNKFNTWAGSFGAQYSNWYNVAAYRDNTLLYTK